MKLDFKLLSSLVLLFSLIGHYAYPEIIELDDIEKIENQCTRLELGRSLVSLNHALTLHAIRSLRSGSLSPKTKIDSIYSSADCKSVELKTLFPAKITTIYSEGAKERSCKLFLSKSANLISIEAKTVAEINQVRSIADAFQNCVGSQEECDALRTRMQTHVNRMQALALQSEQLLQSSSNREPIKIRTEFDLTKEMRISLKDRLYSSWMASPIILGYPVDGVVWRYPGDNQLPLTISQNSDVPVITIERTVPMSDYCFNLSNFVLKVRLIEQDAVATNAEDILLVGINEKKLL